MDRVDAHFVTITSVPRKLETGATSFPVIYVDPWGGKICQGDIMIPVRGILADGAAGSPCLEAVFPQAAVGKKLVRRRRVEHAGRRRRPRQMVNDQPSTSSIASMSSCMVASVSLPMLEMRKVVPLILP